MPVTDMPREGAGLVFDHAAADEAVHQLHVTVGSLIELAYALDAAYPLVTDGWEGRFRTTFDDRIGRASGRLQAIMTELKAAALMIEARAIQADVRQGPG